MNGSASNDRSLLLLLKLVLSLLGRRDCRRGDARRGVRTGGNHVLFLKSVCFYVCYNIKARAHGVNYYVVTITKEEGDVS